MNLPLIPALPSAIEPDATSQGTFMVLGIIFSAIIAILLAYAMIRLIWRIRWKSQTIAQYVHMRNLGNLPRHIDVGAYSPGRSLMFKYIVDGQQLVVKKTPPAQLPSPAVPPMEDGQGIQASRPEIDSLHPTSQPPVDKKSSIGEAAASTQAKVKKVSGIAALGIDILGTLGSLIPGPAGESLKQKSTQLQIKKAAIVAKGQAPTRAVKQAQHLQQSTQELKGEIGVTAPPEVQAGEAAASNASAATTPVDRRHPASQTATSATRGADQTLSPSYLPCPEYVQLPPLQPAGMMRLELQITPSNPYYHGNSIYWVVSRANERSSALPLETCQPEKAVQEISFAGISRGFWLLTILLSAAAAVANAAWFFAFVRWLSIVLA